MVKTVYFPDRNGWRKWLSENFDKEDEIWLLIPKKSSSEKRILYNDTVEEALCFGWIDSIQRPYDEHHTIQRFSPRRGKAIGHRRTSRGSDGWIIMGCYIPLSKHRLRM
jgi:uncharacterized protein YdeI (YjbR/CyaY-like superfamily)